METPPQEGQSGDPGTEIGGRIRQARLAHRLTLADLADASGLTKGFISKLERNQANVSVASLIRICDALDLQPGELFEAPPGQVVRHDAYPPINFGGSEMTEYLLTPQSEHRLQAILSEIRPGGGSGPEQYELPADVEFVLVLDGELEVELGADTVSLAKGDAMTFSAETKHTFRNPNADTGARVLWVFSPALPVSE
ncbi:XRE family transcriptional regulator [Nocardioidaceae bacterium SCSIO 66511]|nr:XRE family transcriptional regulator [Nocardioidaceae bacterium SCSIO 66511]